MHLSTHEIFTFKHFQTQFQSDFWLIWNFCYFFLKIFLFNYFFFAFLPTYIRTHKKLFSSYFLKNSQKNSKSRGREKSFWRSTRLDVRNTSERLCERLSELQGDFFVLKKKLWESERENEKSSRVEDRESEKVKCETGFFASYQNVWKVNDLWVDFVQFLCSTSVPVQKGFFNLKQCHWVSY